jgi:transposase-like protein
MRTGLSKSYSEELKEKIVKECIETDNYKVVSSRTIMDWDFRTTS